MCVGDYQRPATGRLRRGHADEDRYGVPHQRDARPRRTRKPRDLVDRSPAARCGRPDVEVRTAARQPDARKRWRMRPRTRVPCTSNSGAASHSQAGRAWRAARPSTLPTCRDLPGSLRTVPALEKYRIRTWPIGWRNRQSRCWSPAFRADASAIPQSHTARASRYRFRRAPMPPASGRRSAQAAPGRDGPAGNRPRPDRRRDRMYSWSDIRAGGERS